MLKGRYHSTTVDTQSAHDTSFLAGDAIEVLLMIGHARIPKAISKPNGSLCLQI
jgi:hypothetical protein